MLELTPKAAGREVSGPRMTREPVNADIVRLASPSIEMAIQVGKGADIVELRYRPRDLDVLWKTPWGFRDPSRLLPTGDSRVAWLEAYSGGWQVLFPSAGDPCLFNGAEMTFHGEASLAPWDHEIDGDGLGLRARLRLARSPLVIERRLRLEADRPIMRLHEWIMNESPDPVDVVWGHHPAFGEPFLDDSCVIACGATEVIADDRYSHPDNPLDLDGRYRWPIAETKRGQIDLSRLPPRSERRTLFAYLAAFEEGWFSITNRRLQVGLAMSWPADAFPFAWFWQEFNASSGYPWYRQAYVAAIEPFSSYPGHGIQDVQARTGTQIRLDAGAVKEVDLVVTFFERTDRVTGVTADGRVRFKNDGG